MGSPRAPGGQKTSPRGSDFQGNFRKPVFVGGVRFPKEFPETYVRAKPSTAPKRVQTHTHVLESAPYLGFPTPPLTSRTLTRGSVCF